jgi:non-heme chloroperoxidase
MHVERRDILKSAVTLAVGAMAAGRASAADRTEEKGTQSMSHISARDGTRLFCRSWGEGRPVLFASAWMLNSQAWQYQMAPLSEAGFRCVAFDRRGHGRSSDPGTGFDLDTLSNDLATVINALDLSDVTLVGHSMGCAEIVRYLTRHGSSRISRIVLIAPTTPCLLKTADNPDGQDATTFEALRAAIKKDFSGAVAANIKPFFNATTSQAMMDWVVAMTQQNSLKAILECQRAFSTADFRGELPRITVPALVIQGDADMSAPFALTGKKTAALIPNCRLNVYEGAPHGLIYTHMDRVNADLLAFLRS